MTARTIDFMPLDKVLFRRNITEALVDYLDQRQLTAKQAARRYNLDPATIQNLRSKNVCALSTLLAIVLVEGRDLWEAIGDEVFGETLDAYEERRLQQIINEAADAREKLVRIRARREALDARAADALDAWGRPPAQRSGDRHG